jgi:hypothetical protein
MASNADHRRRPPKRKLEATLLAILESVVREGGLTPAKLSPKGSSPRKPTAPLDKLLQKLTRDRKGR